MAAKILKEVKTSLREDLGRTEEEITSNLLKLVSSDNYFKCDNAFDYETEKVLVVYNLNTILISKNSKVLELKIDVNKILDRENCYINKIRKVGNNIKVMVACPVDANIREKYEAYGYKEYVKAINFDSIIGTLVTYIDITDYLKEIL